MNHRHRTNRRAGASAGTRRVVGCSALVASAALVTFTPRAARATDGEVTSDTAGQFYDVRSPTGATVLPRRRLTTMLGVSAYDLLNAPVGDVKAPDLSLRARVRYDADYGASGDTTDPTKTDFFVPGYSSGMVDVMYAYLEGRRFFGGALGFKLGRQYVTDALGWWSFDGGEVSVTTPFFVKAEAYGGFEQRGGLPLSTSRFESDGIWRGDRSNYPSPTVALYPSFQPASPAPAFGVALESTGVTWIHGRLTYRRVYNTGESNVTEFASGLYTPALYDGLRISSDRLGYAFDASWAKVGGVKGGVVYDMYLGEVTHGYLSIDGYPGQKVTVGADVDYYVPSFDADSIWNFFAGQPWTDFALRGNVDLSRQLSVAATAHLKFFTVQNAPFAPVPPPNQALYSPSTNAAHSTPGSFFPSDEHPFDEGATLSARWRRGETTVRARASGTFRDGVQGTYGGHEVGGDVSAERVFERRYVARARVGVWDWQDPLRPEGDVTTGNYVLAVGYRFAPRCSTDVEWEHDINRIVGQRFRVMVRLTLAVTQ